MIVNNKKGQNIDLFSKLIQRIVNLKQIIEKNPKKGMTIVKSWFLLIVELLLCKILPSIYQLSSDFVKQLLRIQIQKGRNVFLWNQVKSWMDAIMNIFYLCLIPAAQPRVLSEESLTASGPPPFEEGWCCFLFFGKVCVPISAKVLPPTWFGQGWCWLTLGRGSGESTV